MLVATQARVGAARPLNMITIVGVVTIIISSIMYA